MGKNLKVINEQLQQIKKELEDCLIENNIKEIIILLKKYVIIIKILKAKNIDSIDINVVDKQIDNIYYLIKSGLKIKANNFEVLYQLKYIYYYLNDIEKLIYIQKLIMSLMKKTRRYIDPNLNIKNFFHLVNKDKIEYVILRWFENLPEIAKGEDIDLLVSDSDINKISRYLIPYPVNNAQPIDLYSCSGIRGSDYAELPYYPKYIAETIIENRVLYRDNYYIPCDEDYFLSLIYHVVYHKAERSGLPIDISKKTKQVYSEHDYLAIIEKLFSNYNIKTNIDLTSLHQILCTKS